MRFEFLIMARNSNEAIIDRTHDSLQNVNHGWNKFYESTNIFFFYYWSADSVRWFLFFLYYFVAANITPFELQLGEKDIYWKTVLARTSNNCAPAWAAVQHCIAHTQTANQTTKIFEWIFFFFICTFAGNNRRTEAIKQWHFIVLLLLLFALCLNWIIAIFLTSDISFTLACGYRFIGRLVYQLKIALKYAQHTKCGREFSGQRNKCTVPYIYILEWRIVVLSSFSLENYRYKSYARTLTCLLEHSIRQSFITWQIVVLVLMYTRLNSTMFTAAKNKNKKSTSKTHITNRKANVVEVVPLQRWHAIGTKLNCLFPRIELWIML